MIHINIQLSVSTYSVIAIPERHFMSAYHVSFFKTLFSSDGHPSKCLQYQIDIADAESSMQAMETACKSFEGLYGAPWNLHADSIDVIADRDSTGAR